MDYPCAKLSDCIFNRFGSIALNMFFFAFLTLWPWLCDLDLWPFDLIFISGRGVVMNYPCKAVPSLVILIEAVLVLSCGQTDTQTESQIHRTDKCWPYKRFNFGCGKSPRPPVFLSTTAALPSQLRYNWILSVGGITKPGVFYKDRNEFPLHNSRRDCDSKQRSTNRITGSLTQGPEGAVTTKSLKPAFHSNAIACVACVA